MNNAQNQQIKENINPQMNKRSFSAISNVENTKTSKLKTNIPFQQSKQSAGVEDTDRRVSREAEIAALLREKLTSNLNRRKSTSPPASSRVPKTQPQSPPKGVKPSNAPSHRTRRAHVPGKPTASRSTYESMVGSLPSSVTSSTGSNASDSAAVDKSPRIHRASRRSQDPPQQKAPAAATNSSSGADTRRDPLTSPSRDRSSAPSAAAAQNTIADAAAAVEESINRRHSTGTRQHGSTRGSDADAPLFARHPSLFNRRAAGPSSNSSSSAAASSSSSSSSATAAGLNLSLGGLQGLAPRLSAEELEALTDRPNWRAEVCLSHVDLALDCAPDAV